MISFNSICLAQGKRDLENEQSQLLQWAQTYFLAQQMIHELPKYVQATKLDGTELYLFLSTNRGKLLWKKTVLARRLSDVQEFNLTLDEADRKTVDAADKHFTETKHPFQRANKTILKEADVDKLIEIVANSIEDKTDRHQLTLFSSPEISKICSNSTSDLAAFRKFAQQNKASNLSNFPGKTHRFLQGWSMQRKQCLSLKLATDQSDLELLTAFLQAMVTFNQGQELDPVLYTMTAGVFIQTSNYAEALRVVHQLFETDSSHRYGYNATQRLFNYQQRGSGEVVIQSL